MKCEGCNAPMVLGEIQCPYCGLPYPERVSGPVTDKPWDFPWWLYSDWHERREWNIPARSDGAWTIAVSDNSSVYSPVYP